MKRLLSLAALTMLTFGATTIKAQVKVDEAGIQKKIAKSDADIQNEKKNIKPAVWIERGKVFSEAASAPTNGIYVNIDETALTLMFGKAEAITKKVAEEEYKVVQYPYFDAYMKDGKVVFWEQKKNIIPDALAKSFEAYTKAYEIDKEAKIKDGLLSIAQLHKQDAGNFFAVQNYTEAAKNFRAAYDAQIHPSVNMIDTSSVFNAGFLYTVALDYQNGIDNLKEALKYKYENDGDLYYYMFHCYFGLKDNENAKNILLQGLGQFPKNNRIIEGLLGLYSSSDSDPKEIIPIVEKAVTNDPKNPELWGGLGRIYDKLGETDKSIEAFQKAVDLAPNDFSANFNLGLLFIKKADAMSQVLNQQQFTSQKEYDEAFSTVFDFYEKSIAPLEKAYEANPSETATIDLLKNVTFRLRDREGIKSKHEKYDALHKALQK